jgi:UDP-2-acetamido-2,6-beta-L-arabino-hexul-4-ose reductase
MDKKIKIGITGQTGFIGTHLYNTLGLYSDEFIRIPFKDEYFNNEKDMKNFVEKCDVIVHLAAMNRHNNPDIIYNTNINLVQKLINACSSTRSTPHIIFSSSSQEEKDNLYGRSKREGRKLFEEWAYKNNAVFSGLIIPNVFGPFGQPYYNSVVATFCHQLTHNETPTIDIDASMSLIYVAELVEQILKEIRNRKPLIKTSSVKHTKQIKVSILLEKLKDFKEQYVDEGIIPDLSDPFIKNLFNTFVCYIDHEHYYPKELKASTDQRGSFIEAIKLNSGGQVSFSTTKSDIARGNHYHIRKFERFVVLKGKARVDIRQIGTESVITFELSGETPSFIDMPIWYTHNITNVGKDDLFTLFWINEHFDPKSPDTFYEEV